MPALGGRGILVLLHGVYGSVAERGRAGDDFNGSDMAFRIHHGGKAHVASDEIAHGIGWIDGLDCMFELCRDDGGVLRDDDGLHGEGGGRSSLR